MIKTEKLSYEYSTELELSQDSSNVRALDNVNIEIKEGSFVAVLGHNGSGKSTFAKMLNAILLPTDGVVYVDGKRTDEENNIEYIRRNAGMVFQNPDNQIIGAIVEEDVGFGPENLQVPTEEIWERVNKSLDKVGMIEFRNSSPNKLSGGQKQRVAIAGVLAMKPKCIVLDEPTAMLDPNGRKEVIDTIYRLNKEDGVTIVLITHYMEEVVNADRVIVMNNGKVEIDDVPKEVFKKVKKLKELQLEVPAITKLSFDLIDSGVEIPVCYSLEELLKELKMIKGDKNDKA